MLTGSNLVDVKAETSGDVQHAVAKALGLAPGEILTLGARESVVAFSAVELMLLDPVMQRLIAAT
jgi:hypothetical protein